MDLPPKVTPETRGKSHDYKTSRYETEDIRQSPNGGVWTER